MYVTNACMHVCIDMCGWLFVCLFVCLCVYIYTDTYIHANFDILSSWHFAQVFKYFPLFSNHPCLHAYTGPHVGLQLPAFPCSACFSSASSSSSSAVSAARERHDHHGSVREPCFCTRRTGYVWLLQTNTEGVAEAELVPAFINLTPWLDAPCHFWPFSWVTTLTVLAR